jgi:hypothetical protein
METKSFEEIFYSFFSSKKYSEHHDEQHSERSQRINKIIKSRHGLIVSSPPGSLEEAKETIEYLEYKRNEEYRYAEPHYLTSFENSQTPTMNQTIVLHHHAMV